jgi:Ca-activated chloride channel family protein
MKFARVDAHWIPATVLIPVVCFAFIGCGKSVDRTVDESHTLPSQVPAADDQVDTMSLTELDSEVSDMQEPAAPGGLFFGGPPTVRLGESSAAETLGLQPGDKMKPSGRIRGSQVMTITPEPSPAALPEGPPTLRKPKGAGVPIADRPMPGSRQGKESQSENGVAENQPTPAGPPELADAKLQKPTADGRSRSRESTAQGSLRDRWFQGPALAESKKKALQLDLQPGEELWVIARAVDTGIVPPNPDVPGCGALMAILPNQAEQVPVPLKHTAVKGNIDGYIATVDVTQQFHNPYDSKIEAVYVFPLPQDAAVNEFVMTVGDRKIRGIIREREKAEQIYAAAKSQGHVAALMTQERPNIFTQKVANIEPGKQIDINIRYFNTLRYDDGAYEFVFPMVVGPRFNPPATADGVAAVARGGRGADGQKTEVQYLAPRERSGHDISLSLNIVAGVDVENVRCVNHSVDVEDICESQRRVTLSSQASIPNKDFVLRYKVAGDQIRTAMLTHEDDHGKYFTMMLYPPADLAQVQRSPMEIVFVLDCSGSMRGKPIAQAKAAISCALQSLTPRDSFQIIRFSNNASQLGPEPVLATETNIERGLRYVTSLNGTGGTHMIEGIKAALDFPHDEGRFRLVSFMTDGYIGNEQQIMSTIHDKVGPSRIFSFGVGSSPNRFLMDRMAIIGRGAVAYLSLNDNATTIMNRFYQSISHPAMTDLSIDFGNMDVADVYPQRLPDLIVGRPVVVTGRFRGEPDTVSVTGRVDMEATSFTVSLDEEDASKDHSGVAAVWARLKIKDMVNYAVHQPAAADEIRQAVTQTALSYNLMSSFTAFVAVDSLTKTEGDFGTTVAVPVPVPEGVKYETSVGGSN